MNGHTETDHDKGDTLEAFSQFFAYFYLENADSVKYI